MHTPSTHTGVHFNEKKNNKKPTKPLREHLAGKEPIEPLENL